jgi:hypothetical protein
MSWSKPYAIDFGPTGDNVKQGIDKLEDNIDDVYTNLNSLKNTFVGTSAPTTGADIGQIWGDSNHTPILYKFYNGSLWIPLTKPSYAGQMINGQIAVSVASNNLTVAIKTRLGSNPTPSDPVVVRIGDTDRTISAALSVTANAATNWGNIGAAELATLAHDLFVYLGYNATDGVVIGFSRIPTAKKYSDFSVTSTNEKFCKISTITTAAATDVYELIGRFDAILSAGTGYTWTLPGTQIIVQRPIFETEERTWTPTMGGFSGTPTVTARYIIKGPLIFIYILVNSGTSNANTFTFTGPIKALRPGYLLGSGQDNTANLSTAVLVAIEAGANLFTLSPTPAGAPTTWTASGSKSLYHLSGTFEY